MDKIEFEVKLEKNEDGSYTIEDDGIPEKYKKCELFKYIEEVERKNE